MGKAKFSNLRRALIVFFAILFSFLYCYLCFFVSSDLSFAETQIAGIPFLNSFPSDSEAPLHSGRFYMKRANRLQYMSHDPAEISRLYRASLLASPGDPSVFLAYAEYLNGRNCCKDQIALLLEAALRRDPRSFKLLFATTAFLVEAGKGQAAQQYFHNTVKTNREASWRLLKLMLERDKDVSDLIGMLPRDESNLWQLLRVLSSRGPRYRAVWMTVFDELGNRELEPARMMEIANQALRMEEMDIARDYAIRAQQHPQTKESASRLLKKVEKRRKKRESS